MYRYVIGYEKCGWVSLPISCEFKNPEDLLKEFRVRAFQHKFEEPKRIEKMKETWMGVPEWQPVFRFYSHDFNVNDFFDQQDCFYNFSVMTVDEWFHQAERAFFS